MNLIRLLAIAFLIYLLYKLFSMIFLVFRSRRSKEPDEFVTTEKEKKRKIISKDEGEYVDFEEIDSEK